MNRVTKLLMMCCLGLGLGLASAARAEDYALLVGASSYPTLPESRHLNGPRNDVSLMYNVLLERNFAPENITVLADTLEQSQVESTIVSNDDPTKAAIIGALGEMAGRVEDGDFVYIHFSGHGAMQPEIGEGDEDDGLDEFFVPLDVGTWSSEVDSVENALLDDELAPLLTAIRENGAFVWIVFDQCNAGTATRGASDIKVRAVGLSEFGIPTDLMPTTRGGGTVVPARMKMVAEADMVAFYAVHPGESALERRMPRGALHGAKSHGIFTYAMAQSLRDGTATSYRDLSTAIQQVYRGQGVPGTPLFEGDLDQQVFSQAPAPRKILAEVSAAGLNLQAGLLDGISEEAILALYPVSAKDGPLDQPLGHAYAYDLTYTTASLTPQTGEGYLGFDLASLPHLVEARLLSQPIDLTLRVAVPNDETLADPAFSVLAEAISGLQENTFELNGQGAAIEWVSMRDDADYYLQAEGDYVRFVTVANPPAGNRPSAPSLRINDSSAETERSVQKLATSLNDALQRLAKARNLFLFADMISDDDTIGGNLSITAYIYRDSRPLPPLSEDGPRDNRACKRFSWKRTLDKMEAVTDATTQAGHCDILVYGLQNTGESVLDVTGLYVDRAGGISKLQGQVSNPIRLEPGTNIKYLVAQVGTWDITSNTPMTIGIETVAFIAVEQAAKSAVLADYSFLQQPSLSMTRGAGATLFERQLQAFAYPDGATATRGNLGTGPAATRAEIRSFYVNVVPPE